MVSLRVGAAVVAAGPNAGGPRCPMIEALTLTAAEQQEAWRLWTQEGDQDAATRLARSVSRWVSRKAWMLALDNGLMTEDIESVAWERFVYALRSYKPGKGSFLNYFAFCAAREMVEVAARERERQKRTKPLGRVTWGNNVVRESKLEPAAPDVSWHSELTEMDRALSVLTDDERYVLCSKTVVYGRPVRIRVGEGGFGRFRGSRLIVSDTVLAAELGIDCDSVDEIFRLAYAKVRKSLREDGVNE